MDLHQAIITVLQKANKGLSVKDIWESIAKDKLYEREDGLLLPLSQVDTRISTYKNFFRNENGLIYLRRNDKRLLRLTWNTNGWETPIQHKWKKENQGKSNIAYENQYGFGGEEWLFNPRYIREGYQYGYIRGITLLEKGVNTIDEVILFTHNQDSHQRFLIGKILKLEILLPGHEGHQIGNRLFDHYRSDMRIDLKEAKADLSGFTEEFIPCVRFKPSDSELFDSLIPIPELKGRQYNRFMPYHIEGHLENILNGKIQSQHFRFIPGISKNTKSFKRETNASSNFVKRVHSSITDDLVKYFAPEYSVTNENISVERTPFRENVADIVLQHNNKSHTIIEVKTSTNARKNIREALGQLIDYGFWFNDIRLREMIIISPAQLGSNEMSYLKRVQGIIKAKISYWYYDGNRKEVNDRFEKII